MSVQMMSSGRAKLEPHAGITRSTGKQSCETTQTGNNSCVAAKESQEIWMCRNKGIPATPLLRICHYNATVKGTNAEAREKKVA